MKYTKIIHQSDLLNKCNFLVFFSPVKEIWALPLPFGSHTILET